MHRPNERGGGSARWVVAIAVIALAGGLIAWLLVFRDGGGILGMGEDPRFKFSLGRVSSVATDGKAPKGDLVSAARDLRETLDAMYLAGFVDPGKWEDGTFPEVLEAFSPGAAKGARRDLADLTLGSTYADVDSVDPGRSRVDVEFLLTKDRKPFAAVATTSFRATGTLSAGGTLDVVHRGRYVMQPVDGQWRIVTYRVTGKLRPGAPATPGPEVST